MHTKHYSFHIAIYSLLLWAIVPFIHGSGSSDWLISDALYINTLPYERILPGRELEQTPKPVQKAIRLPIAKVKAEETVVAHKSRHVPILMYHYVRTVDEAHDKVGFLLSVTPENFDKQLAYLNEHGFTSISPQELYESLFNEKPLPQKPILITFDDGYEDFYTHAVPLLVKHSIKATIFIPSDRISTRNYMTWPQVLEIAQNPAITIASHTRHHVNLNETIIDQLDNEITQSRLILERHLGRAIDFFAYPYGAFNAEVIKEVKKAGYKLAFSTLGGFSHTVNDQYTLRRVNIGGNYDMAKFSGTVGQ